MKKILLLMMLCLGFSSICQSAVICGDVVDRKNDSKLTKASVELYSYVLNTDRTRVKEILIGTMTDEGEGYCFENLSKGTYGVVSRVDGYLKNQRTVEIYNKRDRVENVEIPLYPSEPEFPCDYCDGVEVEKKFLENLIEKSWFSNFESPFYTAKFHPNGDLRIEKYLGYQKLGYQEGEKKRRSSLLFSCRYDLEDLALNSVYIECMKRERGQETTEGFGGYISVNEHGGINLELLFDDGTELDLDLKSAP